MTENKKSSWPLWEVFIQHTTGEAHQHAGSVHAPDMPSWHFKMQEMFITRRGEAVSLWVVPSTVIVASSPSDSGPFFDPGNDKAYRHPQFYSVPKGVREI